MERKSFLGVDFGGTKINFVLIKGREIIYKTKVPTGEINSHKDIVEKLALEIKNIEEKTSIIPSAVGVGLAGMVNHKKGRVIFLPNIAQLKDFTFTENLSKKIGLPVFLENDVNTALIGEAQIGVAQNKKDVIFIAIGTGIGGAILVSHKLYTGKNGLAGEIGHITVQENGLLCNCGKRGCLETVASGTGIERYVRKMIERGVKTKIKKEEITAERIAEYAKQGDKLAIKAYKRASHYIAKVCGGLVNIFDPEMIILGGGVTESGLILEGVKKEIKKYALPELLKGTEIVTSVLKNDAGAIGAAFLAQINESGKNIYV